jgi:peptidylprolyl isomerase
VAAVDEESVTLDFNHPLAGQDLTFDITLVEVSET